MLFHAIYTHKATCKLSTFRIYNRSHTTQLWSFWNFIAPKTLQKKCNPSSKFEVYFIQHKFSLDKITFFFAEINKYLKIFPSSFFFFASCWHDFFLYDPYQYSPHVPSPYLAISVNYTLSPKIILLPVTPDQLMWAGARLVTWPLPTFTGISLYWLLTCLATKLQDYTISKTDPLIFIFKLKMPSFYFVPFQYIHICLFNANNF